MQCRYRNKTPNRFFLLIEGRKPSHVMAGGGEGDVRLSMLLSIVWMIVKLVFPFVHNKIVGQQAHNARTTLFADLKETVGSWHFFFIFFFYLKMWQGLRISKEAWNDGKVRKWGKLIHDNSMNIWTLIDTLAVWHPSIPLWSRGQTWPCEGGIRFW